MASRSAKRKRRRADLKGRIRTATRAAGLRGSGVNQARGTTSRAVAGATGGALARVGGRSYLTAGDTRRRRRPPVGGGGKSG